MILTMIEHEDGAVATLSQQALALAADLAKQAGSDVHAIVLGADVEALAESLGQFGVSTVYVAEDDELENFAPDAWSKIVMEVAAEFSAETILSSSSDHGGEVMARVAARLDQPLAANCLAVKTGDDYYELTRMCWGGSLNQEARLHGSPKLLTVAPHIFEPVIDEDADEPDLEFVDVDLDDADLLVRVKGVIVPERDGVSLVDAPIVVSGGRGVGSKEGFDPLDELATLTGGAVGCSRAVTNHGWRPHADQVGQTGNRVAPNIYIACGISGASQHMAGCSSAKHLLVINTDEEAPILSKADTAVIGDLHEVIPAISAEIKRRR